MNHEPDWLDSLSAGPAPEAPAAFLGAVRARRAQRIRTRVIAGAFLVALTAGALWVSLPASLHPPTQPIAELPPSPPHTVPPPVSDTPEDLFRTASGFARELDRIAMDSPGADDRQWRIGDHWDLDRVRQWVLD